MQRVAFRLAGLLWLVLGILAVLTVFGTVMGLALAWLVGVRRSITAARAGAALRVALFIPCQLIIDVTGCRNDDCGVQPHLLAYGLPALVVALNLAAGWRDDPRPTAPGDPGSDATTSLGAGI